MANTFSSSHAEVQLLKLIPKTIDRLTSLQHHIGRTETTIADLIASLRVARTGLSSIRVWIRNNEHDIDGIRSEFMSQYNDAGESIVRITKSLETEVSGISQHSNNSNTIRTSATETD
jgi:hypothetical protein